MPTSPLAAPEAPSSRLEAVRRSRDEHGRRSLVVLPVHYPKEILTALQIHAVELWGPPGPPRGGEAGRLQTYVCAVVRNALAFLCSGAAAEVDGALFPQTCDSLQGLATELTDLVGWTKPAFMFHHPRGADRPSATRFLESEMRSLARELEAFSGTRLTDEALREAIRLHDEIDLRRAALFAGRSRLPLSDQDFYALLRRGEWIWPEEHLAELDGALAMLRDEAVQAGLPILVTGYVPEPPALLGTLRAAGAFVAADDYAAVGRRIAARDRRQVSDPWKDLVARYLAFPPCPTRGIDGEARMRYLSALAAASGARGVLVHVQKFCDPELFDLPLIRRTFAGLGLPVLVLEGELESELSAQAANRLEAFVELLRAAA